MFKEVYREGKPVGKGAKWKADQFNYLNIHLRPRVCLDVYYNIIMYLWNTITL